MSAARRVTTGPVRSIGAGWFRFGLRQGARHFSVAAGGPRGLIYRHRYALPTITD